MLSHLRRPSQEILRLVPQRPSYLKRERNEGVRLLRRNLGLTLGNTGDHAAAILLLQEALAGFAAAYGPEHPHSRACQSELEYHEQCLTDPRAAAEHQRMSHDSTCQTTGEAAAVTARILRILSAATNPELSNITVHVLKYKRNMQRYIILLLPER